MIIGLASALMKDNCIHDQIMTIEQYLKKNNKCNLLCFGESFLQGFEGLCWDYEIDKGRAISVDSEEITTICFLAKKYCCALSFGFIENDKDILYSSNLFINDNGEMVDLYRRISKGWKEPIASSEYKEGEEFHCFTYKGIKFATAICGDLWYDENIEAMKKIDKDIILWPLYVDFSVDDWMNDQLKEYLKQTKSLNVPILMINSFVNEINRANGGCYVFYKGKIIKKLDMGNMGILEIDLNETEN